jgi:hypothetical protein
MRAKAIEELTGARALLDKVPNPDPHLILA